MLLHDGSKSEEVIHGFFKEAYELYVKVFWYFEKGTPKRHGTRQQ